ncbi:MAG: putative alpha/beta hydrolase family esterase [Bacteroidia bacterium]|jgi:predicted alpha/beta hydrolase family esterase
MIINIPGLHNSGENHWQSIWEREHPEKFFRVTQRDWDRPDCETWIARIEEELKHFEYQDLVLVDHSVGCVAIIKWFEKYNHLIKGALFVAPSDVDNEAYPTYITGFRPMTMAKLPFKSIVVASSNDHVVDINRAMQFAKAWSSDLHILKDAGHVEPKSGFGKWNDGLTLLQELE